MDTKITLPYFLSIACIVLATWLVHEFAHWLTSELLGYEAIMRLNGVSPVDETGMTDIEAIWISAAGPIVTIIQGATAYFILSKKGWVKTIYPTLLVCFMMRFLAGLMNFNNLNDEGRISVFLGLGTFTLSILVAGFLFFLVYKISKQYQLTGRFQLFTTLFLLFWIIAVIIGDQFLRIRII